jgi:hypothetical protein
LLKKTRSLLDELDQHFLHKDKENVFESRADHVIQGAINLINSLKESYDPDTAAELERRLINSIRAQDANKFMRGIRRAKTNNSE